MVTLGQGENEFKRVFDLMFEIFEISTFGEIEKK